MDQQQFEKLLDEREAHFLKKLEEATKTSDPNFFLFGLIAHGVIKISTQLEFLCSKHD